MRVLKLTREQCLAESTNPGSDHRASSQLIFRPELFSQSHNSHCSSTMWACSFCRRTLPAVIAGSKKKPTISVKPAWLDSPLTIIDAGEHLYPCPDCETVEGHRKITDWHNADFRLHKRLRQHFVRTHQQLLRQKYSATEVVEFYNDARRLRCELIHGPNDRERISEETPVTTPAEVPESTAAKSPETPTRRRARNISARQSQAIELPPSYLDWLDDELRKDSVASYAGIARTFLHWYGENRDKPGELIDVWDVEAVRTFIAELKPQVAPTTVFNYICALQTAQRFVRQRGEFEPSQATIFSFAAMFRQASRAKTEHQRVVAEKKRKTSVTLHEVKERILGNAELYTRFKDLAKFCKSGGAVSQAQFTWATGFALFNLQASNFKRNGNTLKILFKPALKRIQSALKHRKACELVITGATKTGGTEVFSVVKMQRLKVLLMYATALRPSAMGSGKCTHFFVNSLGKRITKASPYITALGKSVDLPNLTIKDLRSRIETEAAVQGKRVDRAAIANHLAHTEATRDKHYLLVDKRRSREAAMDVERLLDEAEPLDDSDADTSLDSSSLDSSEEIEYDDDSSSTPEDEQSPEETDSPRDSSPSSSEPDSTPTSIVHIDEEIASNESKTDCDGQNLSPTPSPSKKRERQPTGLSSESENGDASPMLPSPSTKRARLSARNPEPTLESFLESQAPLLASPPQRTNEVFERSITPSPSLSKKREGPPPNESDASSSPGSINLFHQRPRTRSEDATAEPKSDSGDEGAKSDPGESSPPWTRTLRRRIYTIPKKT